MTPIQRVFDGPPSLEDALHVASAEGGELRAMGAKVVRGLHDNLTYGPSASDLRDHDEVRREFWRGFFRSIPRPPGRRWRGHAPLRSFVDLQKALAQRRRGQAIVLWVTGNGMNRLATWWTCEVLKRLDWSCDNTWVASPPRAWAEADGLNRRIVSWSGERVRQFLAEARPFAKKDMRAGAEAWRAFTHPSPRKLMTLHASGRLDWPLGPISFDIARLFPSVVKSQAPSSLRLSAFDSMLLGMFRGRGWLTPIGAVKANPAALMDIMDAYADHLVVHRLAQWASCAPEVLLSRRVEGKSSFDCCEYFLSAEGERLIDEGLSAAVECPPLQVGGSTAYGPRSRWASAGDAAEWRLIEGKGSAGKRGGRTAGPNRR